MVAAGIGVFLALTVVEWRDAYGGRCRASFLSSRRSLCSNICYAFTPRRARRAASIAAP
jgi:hypothetical protein